MFPVCQIKLLRKRLQRFSTTIFSSSSFSEPVEKWASEFLLSQPINKWIREFFFPAKELSIDQTICGKFAVPGDFIGHPWWLVSLTFKHQNGLFILEIFDWLINV